jgi:hypothetical protein
MQYRTQQSFPKITSPISMNALIPFILDVHIFFLLFFSNLRYVVVTFKNVFRAEHSKEIYVLCVFDVSIKLQK